MSTTTAQQDKALVTLVKLANEIFTLPDTDYPIEMCEARVNNLQEQLAKDIKEFMATL